MYFSAKFEKKMKLNALVYAGAAAILLSACNTEVKNTFDAPAELTTSADTFSYALGVNVAGAMKRQDVTDLNFEAVYKGFRDVYAGNAMFDEQGSNDVLNKYFKKKMDAENDVFKSENMAFLEENAKKEGIQTTETGLQYEVITMGNGPKPTLDQTVKVHYHGTLIDGSVFDSSVDRGEPIEFPVTGVIPGWVEGLQLMPVGSKFKFYIPYDLAYGERGAGQMIKPFSTLIFEVELLEVK